MQKNSGYFVRKFVNLLFAKIQSSYLHRNKEGFIFEVNGMPNASIFLKRIRFNRFGDTTL